MSRIKSKFIVDAAVTNAKLADMAQATIKGRAAAAGTGVPVDLSAAQVKTILDLTGTNSGDVTLAAVGSSPNANGASLSGQVLTLQPFSSTQPGVVPASGGGTTNFLRADGTFAAPAGGGTAITSLTTDVVATGPGAAAATIQANVVSDSKLRQSVGLSVIGRSANTTGNVADITAASDGQILRRSGTTVGFGSLDLSLVAAVGTSILPLANGGTNAALTASNGAIPYSTATALALLAPGTSGQILTSGGAAAPTWQYGSAPQIFGTRASPRSVVAATGITSGASHMSTTALQQDIYVSGSITGDSVAATVTAGTVDGQTMRIIGRSLTNTVSLTIATTNVYLNGNITLGLNQSLTLRWDTSEWVEMSRSG